MPASSDRPAPFQIITDGVVAPLGFRCNAVECGIKDPAKRRLDLGMIFSDTPTVCAATFTKNAVKAAPVHWCMKHVRPTADIRAIIANSGNANACTGQRGLDDARRMATGAADALGIKPNQVLVASTGIIGLPMPIERIEPHIPALAAGLSRDKNDAMARAIMTSDTKPKSIAVEVPIGARKFRIGAVAKGAGMICPNMATMLCFVTTDANISAGDLKAATKLAVAQSFNRISIDGDTSTNDTVLVLANKASSPRPLAGAAALKLFGEALTWVMLEMAKAIVRDGERVTKFVEVAVRNAASARDAKLAAEAVANSLLVKCSWNGGDPNWGRIMHAVGYSGAKFREENVAILFDDQLATEKGLATTTPIEKLRAVAAKPEFVVTIDLGTQNGHAHSVFTSDLSQAYVDFNTTEYAVPSTESLRQPTPK